MGGSSSKQKQPEKSTFDKIKTMVGWALLLSFVFFPIAFPFVPLLLLIYLFLYMIAYFKS